MPSKSLKRSNKAKTNRRRSNRRKVSRRRTVRRMSGGSGGAAQHAINTYGDRGQQMGTNGTSGIIISKP